MSDETSSQKVKTEATSQIPDDDAQKNDDQIAVLVAQENPPDIFKLNVDCCEELFDWLSIEDLYSFGQTCKRMQRIAGMYFQQNYPNARITVDRHDYHYEGTELDGFCEFFENINLHEDVMWTRMRLDKINADCKSLKEITITVKNHWLELGLVNGFLSEIESIILSDEYGFVKKVFDFCRNLKAITIRDSYRDLLSKLNKEPGLEYISLPYIYERISNCERFFKKIPNIQTIEIYWMFLLANKDEFLNVDTKLDNLVIHFWERKGDRTSICQLLNELYDRGFYKRLHFIQLNVDQQWIDRMVSLRALETLAIGGLVGKVIWPVMQNLKKISLFEYDNIDFTTFTSKLPNLKWVHMQTHSTELILTFIRWSKNLSKIVIQDLYKGPRLNENILDLSTLNKERTKLAGACKVMLYIPEEIFLATKYSSGASRSLIEIKRKESLKVKNKWYLG